jgi:polar amino acid transport system substrate-binding protein
MRCKSAMIIFLFTIILFNSNVSTCYSSCDLSLVTNEFPPYTIVKDGEFPGIAVDIVKQLSSLANQPCGIKILPWKRALKESQSHKVLLFPYTKRPYRLTQFKWIGPIMTDTFVFAVNSEDNRKFNAIEDFKNLEVGVIHSGPTEYRLEKLGFDKIQPVSQEKQNARKMIYGNRIDAWYVPVSILTHTLRSEGIKSDRIKIAYKDIDVEMYIAASLSVPDEIVSSWQKNLDDLKKSGQYQQILKKYGYGTPQQ